jgi:hypothetical protein
MGKDGVQGGIVGLKTEAIAEMTAGQPDFQGLPRLSEQCRLLRF